MQREDIIISRVLLEGYRHLDRLHEALGKSIDCLVKSGYNSGYRGTTELIYEKVIEYTYRRAGIYNLKAIVNQTLELLSVRNRDILIFHFIEDKDFGEIKDIFGVSLRTVFRYYDKALQSFAIQLNASGFSESRLEEEYRDEPFFARMKKKVLNAQRVNIERGVRKGKDSDTEKGEDNDNGENNVNDKDNGNSQYKEKDNYIDKDCVEANIGDREKDNKNYSIIGGKKRSNNVYVG